MIQRIVRFASAALMSVMFISGCTNNGSATGPGLSTPSIPSITLKGPNTNSSDAHVKMVKSFVTSMNTSIQMFALLKNLPGLQSGNTWTWTYTRASLTVKLVATSQADGSQQWNMVLNGSDTSTGTKYTNFTTGQGTTSGDGKTGDWKIYDTTSTTPVSEFDWTTNNNVLTGTLKSFSSGVLVGQTIIINNPDNSGQMTEYAGSSLAFKAVWQPNGAGQWWTYDPAGNQTGTGNWT